MNEEIKVGDVCTTEDGQEGTQQVNEDGTFTCVVNAPEVTPESTPEVPTE